jgi:DNA-binding NarL/FixJ family response regulator
MSERRDWVSLIERSYDLEADDTAWLTGLQTHAAPLMGGTQTTAWTFGCTPTTFKLGEFPKDGPKVFSWLVRGFHRLTSESWRDLVYRSGHVVDTASRASFPVQPDMHRLFQRLFGRHAQDILMVGAHSGTGRGVVLATLMSEAVEPTPVQRKRWQQIASHIGAGLRLRALAGQLPIDSEPTEAIFEPGGKLQEACHAAQQPTARGRLREAVQRIERARRAAGRTGADGAMDAWEGLIDGRWSLVDRFDTDGRRFVVAVRNDPAFPDPRGLTPRERQVGEFVGLGQSSKEIAYTLGISLSAVTNAVTSALVKLGLSSRAEFAAFFSLASPRAKLAEVTVGGDRFLLASCPLVDQQSLAELTDAERDVVTHLIAGSTTADIAWRRGSSISTVSSQLQTLYRKLGVHSRSELAARLRAHSRGASERV